MCLTQSDRNASSSWLITIRVLINQDWNQDWEWNKGFKQKKYSFLTKNLHLRLDILHAALPSGNTCQTCNESLLQMDKNKN